MGKKNKQRRQKDKKPQRRHWIEQPPKAKKTRHRTVVYTHTLTAEEGLELKQAAHAAMLKSLK